MYSKSGYGVNAYASVGLETGVLAATPHKLILMLFQGAHVALSSALVHMKNGDITAKGEALSKRPRVVLPEMNDLGIVDQTSARRTTFCAC